MNGSMTERASPTSPPQQPPLPCARVSPLPLTQYLVLLLTGLWKCKLPLLKLSLLHHKTLECLLFYECMLSAEVFVDFVSSALGNTPSLGRAFTYNTKRDQQMTRMFE